MKQFITLITLLALAAPVCAQTVDITLTDNGDGSFTIGYANASEDIAGVSLHVALTGGDGVLADCNDAVAAAPFNFHMDYWNTVGGTPVLGEGCPLGDEILAALPTFPATNFAIYTSVVLDPPAGAPAPSGEIATIVLTQTTCTTITLSADIGGRGGIEGVSGSELVATFPAAKVVCFECMKSIAPEYADWVTYGKPDCWCYRRQCRGDGNGTGGYIPCQFA